MLELLDAAQQRGALGTRMNLFHEDYDLLLTPTMPIEPLDAAVDPAVAGTGAQWTGWTPFTYPFNLTQQPAASIPCGLTGNGLPVGLQIVGPRYADGRVLRAARAFESLQPFPGPARELATLGA